MLLKYLSTCSGPHLMPDADGYTVNEHWICFLFLPNSTFDQFIGHNTFSSSQKSNMIQINFFKKKERERKEGRKEGRAGGRKETKKESNRNF